MGVEPTRRISGDQLFGLGFAFAQDLVQDDCTKGCNTYGAQGKAPDIYLEIASSNCQGNSNSHQVATLGEVHSVLYPDASACGCNQAEENNSQSTKYTQGNGMDQRTKFGTEANQYSKNTCDQKAHCDLDPRQNHNSNVLT